MLKAILVIFILFSCSVTWGQDKLVFVPQNQLHFVLNGMVDCKCDRYPAAIGGCTVYHDYEGYIGDRMTILFEFSDGKTETIKVDELLKAGSFKEYFK